MLQSLFNFIFYNETRFFIQKNVLVLTKVSFLHLLVMTYQIVTGVIETIIADIAILIIIFLIWYSIKKYRIYYSNLIFLIILPLLSRVIHESVVHHGVIGITWSFPIIAIVYFCFYKYLAWLATAIILAVTLFCSVSYFTMSETVIVMVSLLMVTFCFINVFLNIYKQYSVLEDKANRDQMTGLLNRHSLKDRLLESILLNKPNLHTIVLAIDLDNFKYINDNFGHTVGDAVLIHISQLFQDNLRKTDNVFRMGGEEFLILLNNISIEDAQNIAENLRIKTERSDFIKNHTVTISVGLAAYQAHDDWSHWLKLADDAMYKAKRTGKNKVLLAENQ